VIDVEAAMVQVHPLPAEAVEVIMVALMDDKIRAEEAALDIPEE
jgi:hypothetical protein